MNPGGFALEGQGWRLAWDAARHPFPVLLGGDGWAAEFTRAEILQLREALHKLMAEHRALTDQLMAEEELRIEFERSGWWLGLEGDRNSWTLRFVLSPEPGLRAIEGIWLPEATAALVEALQALPL